LLALAVLWAGLKIADLSYKDGVPFYRAASTAGEAFLYPVTPAALVALGLLLLFLRRRRRRPRPLEAFLAPEVHIMEAPPGMLTVVIGGGRGAIARDHTVERDPTEERRILDELDELARRIAGFDAGVAGRSWTADEIQETQRRIYAIGLGIGRTLLGGEVADALTDLPGDHLQLSVQPGLSEIPWELAVAGPGGLFLWQLFALSRQLRDPVGPKHTERRLRLPLRMLLLANLEAGIPGRALNDAEREAAELLELGAARPGLLRVVRKSPRSAEELARLVREGYDIIHFAGHTSDPGELKGGWVLGDGSVTDPSRAMAGMSDPPLLVFANACSSSPGSRTGENTDAARALMRVGAASYLCTLWKLHDEGSGAFSAAFYRAILAGETLGTAVTEARTALLGAHPITWANYVLYGDPALRPVPPGGKAAK
jgi:MYXO-CTERM domain-containing protein